MNILLLLLYIKGEVKVLCRKSLEEKEFFLLKVDIGVILFFCLRDIKILKRR